MTVCASCKVFACRTGRLDAAPDDCPMKVIPEIVDTREILPGPGYQGDGQGLGGRGG